MRIDIVLSAVAAGIATLAFGEMTIEQQKTWERMGKREMLLSRERVSIGNDWFIVEHWQNQIGRASCRERV